MKASEFKKLFEKKNWVKNLVDQGAIFFVSHSGGKDSQAQYIEVCKQVPHDQIVVIHADLPGAEWSQSLTHIKATVDHEVHVVRGVRTFFEMVRNRGMFPSPQYRECTNTLKTNPIDKLIRKIMKERGVDIAVNCIGLRAEESPNRKAKDEWDINPRLTLFEYTLHPEGKRDKKGKIMRVKNKECPTGKRMVFDWLPIHKWTTEEVFAEIKNAGQEPHPGYLQGMERISCLICIMASKSDLVISASLHPEHYEKMIKLEQEVGHTIFMKKGQPCPLEDYTGLSLEQARKRNKLLKKNKPTFKKCDAQLEAA